MQSRQHDDYALVKACRRGKTEAFKTIVHKYQNYICALTYSATGNRDKSEELAQEVFVIAWNKLSQLRDCSKFKSWLFQIAQNRIKQFYRTSKRDIIAKADLIDGQTAADKQSDPHQQAISKENQKLVEQALNQIPVHYRDSLILFYWEGKSVRQVARHLDLTETATKKRLSRASHGQKSYAVNI